MDENYFKIGPEAKSSVENEVTEVIDGLIAQLEAYIKDYDLLDDVSVAASHLEEEWVENLADFDLHFLVESITTGFVKETPIDLTPRTIALQLAALQLKRKRVLEASD